MSSGLSLRILLVLLSTVPPDASGPGGVRSTNVRIRGAIEEGVTRSPTFRGLVERLRESTVIVYIERGECRCSRARSCLAFVTSSGRVRYLRSYVTLQQTQRTLIEQIGHELHHATELAEAPDVTSRRGFAQLFAKLAGAGCFERRCFETPDALATEAVVRREIADGPNTRSGR